MSNDTMDVCVCVFRPHTIHTCLNQEIQRTQVPPVRHKVQSRASVAVAQITPTLFTPTRFNQEVQHLQVPPVRRKVQRRAPVAVAHVQGPAAGPEQLGHSEDVALPCQLVHGPRGEWGR